MTQADPWDETARLEKQVEVELLRQLEEERRIVSRARARAKRTEKAPSEH